MDLYREYVFRPCSRETVESCRYQTTKIWIYISPKTRTIFLDSQAANSISLFDDYLRSHRRQISPAENFKIESLHQLIFLTQVCNTIILCFDWFIDLSLIREIMRAELFSINTEEITDRKVNLVLLHHRAKQADFSPKLIEERMHTLAGIFEDSMFDISGGLSLGSLGFSRLASSKSKVNYILLPDIKSRHRAENIPHTVNESKKGVIDYSSVLSALRLNILKLQNRLFPQCSDDITELEWFNLALKIKDQILQTNLTEEDSLKSNFESHYFVKDKRKHLSRNKGTSRRQGAANSKSRISTFKKEPGGRYKNDSRNKDND